MARIYLIALIFLACGAVSLCGQSLSSPVDPFGRIFSASIRPELEDVDQKMRAAPTAPFTVFALGLRDSKSATGGSFSIGYGGSVGRRDFFLNGTYSRAEPDEGDRSNRASAYGQIALLSEDGFADLTAVVTAAYDPDAFRAYGVVLVAEGTVIAEKLTAAANLGWTEVDPDDGGGVGALQPSLGLYYSPNDLWVFSLDYTFDNDVDGEDTGSFAASLRIPRWLSKLKLTGEKHNAYPLSLTRKF